MENQRNHSFLPNLPNGNIYTSLILPISKLIACHLISWYGEGSRTLCLLCIMVMTSVLYNRPLENENVTQIRLIKCVEYPYKSKISSQTLQSCLIGMDR
jgi:hypothetical protein